MEEFIVDGKFDRAERLAGDLPLESARRYYRAWIDFLQGNYVGSLEELSSRKFFIEQYYTQICQLKLINLLKTDKRKEFKREVNICLSELSFDGQNNIWVSSLKDIMFNRAREIEPFALGDREFTIWFKAGTYLQQNDLLERTFLQLVEPGREETSLRELLSLHHYRQGRYKKAFELAHNVDRLNTHNILGRIYMAGDNFEMAWKHFNEALKHRKDSINALEYASSLAWILNRWKEGKNHLIRLGELRKLELEEVALLTAFTIQEGQFKAARKGLDILKKRFVKKLPLEGLLMGSYISLRLKDAEAMIPYALRACLLSEGISCWLLLQQLGWKDFEGLVDSNERIYSEEEIDIEQYRKPVDIVPLQEKILILSRDIEELDRRQTP